MNKKSNDDVDVVRTASKIASIISLMLIFSTTFIYFFISIQLKSSINIKDQEDLFKILKNEMEDHLKFEEDQNFRTARQAWRTQNRWQNNGGSRRREEPKICDCTVIDCPRGPRGPPGDDGNWPTDGRPGQPGKDGVDGIYQVDEPNCPPCPPGPPGDDGEIGDPGESGRPGTPGKPGEPGTNEPGSVGPPGARGQSGRTGPKGASGDSGQDFVQLQGVPGPKGSPGPIGLHGPRGDPGSNGKPAPPGPPGFPGPVGEPGDQGDYGERGFPGRKGSPGQDGGYCQCPPREGPVIGIQQNVHISMWAKNHKTSDDNDYETEWTRPENKNKQFSRNNRQRDRNSIQHQNARKHSSNPELIDVGESTMRRSPLAPLISYKDSREEGHTNRVVMQRNSFNSKGSEVDFELR